MNEGLKATTIGILVSAIMILGVGYMIINTVVDSIDGTSAQNNVTAMNTNTVYGIVPLFLLLGAFVLIIGLSVWYVSTPERYFTANKHIEKIIKFLSTTITYFAYGLFCYAIFGTVAVLLYLSYRLLLFAGETGAGIEIGKWIAVIIGFYFLTAGVGYVFKRYFWDKYKERKLEKQCKENLEDLPKIT